MGLAEIVSAVLNRTLIGRVTNKALDSVFYGHEIFDGEVSADNCRKVIESMGVVSIKGKYELSINNTLVEKKQLAMHSVEGVDAWKSIRNIAEEDVPKSYHLTVFARDGKNRVYLHSVVENAYNMKFEYSFVVQQLEQMSIWLAIPSSEVSAQKSSILHQAPV